jgi:CheY-like chemotaxis protein
MEVETADDGPEAQQKLEQSTPDVILASVLLPGISGYELCRRIKENERLARIPVMLLGGLHEPFDQAEARRVGADDVVSKPFKSIRQLVNRVGALLGGKPADASNADHEYSTLGLGHDSAPAPADHVQVEAAATPVPLVKDSEDVADTGAEDSTIELDHDSAQTPADHIQDEPFADDTPTMADTNVTVFVEAASMTEPESFEPEVEAAGSTCVADVELQTADTQKLEPINDEHAMEAVTPITSAQDDTIEMEPAIQFDEPLASISKPNERETSTGTSEMNEQPSSQSTPAPAVFKDSLLDLGDLGSPNEILVADDLILDLDYDEPGNGSAVTQPEITPEPAAAVEAVQLAEVISPIEVIEPIEAIAPLEFVEPEPVFEPEFEIAAELEPEAQPVAEFQEWAVIAEAPIAAQPAVIATEDQAPGEANLSLSPEMIDAVARRVVELMSDSVVREIAWEVVPELAELLIKKKLEEQKL